MWRSAARGPGLLLCIGRACLWVLFGADTVSDEGSRCGLCALPHCRGHGCALTQSPPPPVMTAYRALIRPSGEDAMGRSCILDAPPRQGDARGSAEARSSADACLS